MIMASTLSVSWFSCTMVICSVLAAYPGLQMPNYRSQKYHHHRHQSHLQQQQHQQYYNIHHHHYYHPQQEQRQEQEQQQQQQQQKQGKAFPSRQRPSKHRQDQLMDPGYLMLPEVLNDVQEMGLLYKEQPLFSWTLETLDDRKRFQHYCPEKVYLTLDPDRIPAEIVHRKCDFSKLSLGANCLTLDNSKFPFVCQDHFYFRKVKVTGTWMYQKVFSGCGCNPTAEFDSLSRKR